MTPCCTTWPWLRSFASGRWQRQRVPTFSFSAAPLLLVWRWFAQGDGESPTVRRSLELPTLDRSLICSEFSPNVFRPVRVVAAQLFAIVSGRQTEHDNGAPTVTLPLHRRSHAPKRPRKHD